MASVMSNDLQVMTAIIYMTLTTRRTQLLHAKRRHIHWEDIVMLSEAHSPTQSLHCPVWSQSHLPSYRSSNAMAESPNQILSCPLLLRLSLRWCSYHMIQPYLVANVTPWTHKMPILTSYRMQWAHPLENITDSWIEAHDGGWHHCAWCMLSIDMLACLCHNGWESYRRWQCQHSRHGWVPQPQIHEYNNSLIVECDIIPQAGWSRHVAWKVFIRCSGWIIRMNGHMQARTSYHGLQ